LEGIECEADMFRLSEDMFLQYGLDRARCLPRNQTFTISGQWSSTQPQYYKAQVMSCREFEKYHERDPDENCESLEAIRELTKLISVDAFIINRQFDTKDFSDNPIKEVVQYYYYNLVEPLATYQVIKVTDNTVTLKDKWHGLQTKIHKYYSFNMGYYYRQNVNIRYFDLTPAYLSLYFLEDENEVY